MGDALSIEEFRLLRRRQDEDVTAGGRVQTDEHTMTDAEFRAVRQGETETTEEQPSE